MLALLGVRLGKLMLADSGYYAKLAEDLHKSGNVPIKAARGRILDRNGEVLADNHTVCAYLRYPQPDHRDSQNGSSRY